MFYKINFVTYFQIPSKNLSGILVNAKIYKELRQDEPSIKFLYITPEKLTVIKIRKWFEKFVQQIFDYADTFQASIIKPKSYHANLEHSIQLEVQNQRMFSKQVKKKN